MSSARALVATSTAPWVLLAAHPDDETVGASCLLWRRPQRAIVVHVTDGAPRDTRLWSPLARSTRRAYARRREGEARRALGLVGIAGSQIRCLGLLDQEVSEHLAPLALRLRDLFLEVRPAFVVVQPYEGGHPDHDACAFAARAAALLFERSGGGPLSVIEMTAYHRADERLCTGAFLSAGSHQLVRRLAPAEQVLKRRMLGCFRSQADVLQVFGVDQERFRRAPHYDFTEPPHPGPLHYETLGWRFSGADFCERAAHALEQLGLCAPRRLAAKMVASRCR